MKFSELLKTAPAVFKREKVDQKFYPGNRVFFVGDDQIPHTGTVGEVDRKGKRLLLYQLTNYIGINKDYTIWVEFKNAIKTAEIFLGEPENFCAVYHKMVSSRCSVARHYKRMPKRVISSSDAGTFTPVIVFDEFMYMRVSGRPELYKVVRVDETDVRIPAWMTADWSLKYSYVLRSEEGKILCPTFFFHSPNLANQGIYGSFDELIRQGCEIIRLDDITEVYETDPIYRKSENKDYDDRFMTIIYKKK